MVWIVGRNPKFQIWPQRHIHFDDVVEKVESWAEFGLSRAPSYSCSILSGRDRSEKFNLEWGEFDELPNQNFGQIMISTDQMGVHVSLLVPDEHFSTLYADLVATQPAEVDIEFGITSVVPRFKGAARALVDGEFRLTARRTLDL